MAELKALEAKLNKVILKIYSNKNIVLEQSDKNSDALIIIKSLYIEKLYTMILNISLRIWKIEFFSFTYLFVCPSTIVCLITMNNYEGYEAVFSNFYLTNSDLLI